VPLGPLRRLGLAPLGVLASSLGLAPLGLLASSLGLAPLGLLASSLGLASLGLRLNPLSSADRVTRRSVSVAGTVAVGSASSRGEKSVRFRSRVKFAATKKKRSPQRSAFSDLCRKFDGATQSN
jgi:hypothetical protein